MTDQTFRPLVPLAVCVTLSTVFQEQSMVEQEPQNKYAILDKPFATEVYPRVRTYVQHHIFTAVVEDRHHLRLYATYSQCWNKCILIQMFVTVYKQSHHGMSHQLVCISRRKSQFCFVARFPPPMTRQTQIQIQLGCIGTAAASSQPAHPECHATLCGHRSPCILFGLQRRFR